MIVSDKVEVTISNNGKFYRDRGYGPCKQGFVIEVLVKDLPANSNKQLDCICDKCEASFSRPAQQVFRSKEHLCYSCTRRKVGNKNKGNTWGFTTNRLMGDKHPRWNSNKKEYKTYAYEVKKISESQPLHLLEDFDQPRGLCGKEGVYQLDHKIPVKFGFENDIPARVIGDLSNLQFISWKENRSKSDILLYTLHHNIIQRN